MKTVQGLPELAEVHGFRNLSASDEKVEHFIDDLLLITSQVCGTPIAVLSCKNESEEWEYSNVELTTTEKSQLDLFRSYVVAQAEPIIISDSQQDMRFASSTSRDGASELRFFAGLSVRLDDESLLGSICLLDRIPGSLSFEQLNALQALQRQIISHIQLHNRFELLRKSKNDLEGELAHRIRVESELTKSIAQYRQISANVPGMVYQFVLHPDGTMSLPFVSEGSRVVYGLEPQDIIDNPDLLLDRVHPDDRSECFRLIAESAAQLTPWKWEGRYVLPGGEQRWVQGASRPEKHENGDIVWDGVVMDFTNVKLEQDARLESEMRYRLVTETASDCIVTIDLNNRVLFVNAAVEEIFGYSPGALAGADFAMLVPDYHYLFNVNGSDSVTGPNITNIPRVAVELTGQHKSGRKLPLEISWGEYIFNGKQFRTCIIRNITERKRLEAAVRQSEEYRRLFELARDAILIIDLHTEVVLEMNDKACEIYGIPRKDFIRLSLDRLSPPTARNGSRLKELLSKGQDHSFESIQHRADGTPLHFLINLSLIDFQGRQAVLSINHNITARRTAEEAQRLSEKRFRSAFDFAPIGMAIVSLDGRFLQVNRSLCAIVGYSETKLLSTDFQTITHVDDLETDLEFVHQVLSGEINDYQFEKRYLHRDGYIVPVLLCVSLVRDDVGQPLYFISQIQDISGRKEAEESLRDSEERYRLLFNRNPLPSWVYDFETLKFLKVNDAAIAHYGYTREEFLAMTIKDIRPPEHVPVLLAANEVFRLGEIVSPGTWRHIKKDQTVIDVEIAAHSLAYGGRAAVLTMVNDVTERKRAEEALRLSEEQLRQSQKMESIGTLAGGVAHDFNNLLTAILGNTQLAMRSTEEGSRLHSRLNEVLKSGNRATTLTRQLLAFSRRQHLERKNIDLNETIADTMKMLQRIIGEDVEVRINMTPNLPLIFADPDQVGQVVMNLAVNARDAMPEGGRLLIETEKVNLDETHMRNQPQASVQKYVRLMVSDSGTGMTPEIRARIFEPFFTTKDVGRGTGLGLSMVYGIVKQHEGSIEVYSEVGCGTVFKIYWPASASNEETEEPATEIVVRGGTETILLAEDEENLRQLAQEILKDLGYTVLVACDGQEAVEIFTSSNKLIDLVMLDVVMPRMNGSEAYTHMLSSRPNLPAVFLTGYSSEMMHFKIAEWPSALLLQKPYSIEGFGLKVREILDRVPAKIE